MGFKLFGENLWGEMFVYFHIKLGKFVLVCCNAPIRIRQIHTGGGGGRGCRPAFFAQTSPSCNMKTNMS